MACNCTICPNIVPASSIAVADGVTTITVPTGTTFQNGSCYCIGLFTTIPAGTNGTQVNITDGTNTYTIDNRLANYWRPCCGLRSRSLLKVKFFNDPNHFLKI
jgi:hypothetical protein